MQIKLNNKYSFNSPENEINNFIMDNKDTIKILNAIDPHLDKHFPNNNFSLEICDKLKWTTEKKLLVNVHVNEEMFFNGLLNHFNDIYSEIEPLTENIICPIVLFPRLEIKLPRLVEAMDF